MNNKVVAPVIIISCMAISFVVYQSYKSKEEGAPATVVAGQVDNPLSTSQPKPSIDPVSAGVSLPSEEAPSVPSTDYVSPPKETRPAVVKNSVEQEDVLAKLWFDARQETATPSVVDELTDKLEKFLETGRLPQIVDKFPLVLATYDDYGFNVNQYSTYDGYINVITMVSPDIKKIDSRVTVFVQNVGDSFVTVKTIKGLNTIAADRGIIITKDSYRYLLAGDVLDKELYTANATIGMYGLEIKGKEVNLLDMDGLTGSLQVAKVSANNKEVVYKSSSETAFFFYNEFKSEDVLEDSLYLIQETNDDSIMYKIDYTTEGVSLTKEKTSDKVVE